MQRAAAGAIDARAEHPVLPLAQQIQPVDREVPQPAWSGCKVLACASDSPIWMLEMDGITVRGGMH